MALLEKELLELKQQVTDAKTKVSELTGQQTAMMNQLKKDWDCTTIEEAEEKIKAMDKTINTINKKIDKGIEELERLLEPEKEE